MWLNNLDSGCVVVRSSEFVKHLYDYRLNWTQSCYHYLLISFYIFALFDFGDPFLKGPDYFLGLKTCFMFVVFQFKIKVSIILKMIQRNYQLKKQNWPVCETVILFNWFWFQNLPAFNFQSKQMAKYFLRNNWNMELQPCVKYFEYTYCQTLKTVNTWKFSGMLIIV